VFSEQVIGLLEQEGRWGFFNGMGADRQISYDVYQKGAICNHPQPSKPDAHPPIHRPTWAQKSPPTGHRYGDFREFFSEQVIGLLEQEGRWGFFNGMGADRQISSTTQ
jgi:hypothetical protein